MNESRVLVAGATGQLGSVITRKLIASGTKVRALARNREALAQFAPEAEIAAVDPRDLVNLTEACRGVDQIVATANNNMGKGRPARPGLISAPTRISAPPLATPASAGSPTSRTRVCRRTRASISSGSSGTSRMRFAGAASPT